MVLSVLCFGYGTMKTMVKTTVTTISAKQRNAARRTVKKIPYENSYWDDTDWDDEDADHERDEEQYVYKIKSPPLRFIVCWSLNLVIVGGILAAIWCRRS